MIRGDGIDLLHRIRRLLDLAAGADRIEPADHAADMSDSANHLPTGPLISPELSLFCSQRSWTRTPVSDTTFTGVQVLFVGRGMRC